MPLNVTTVTFEPDQRRAYAERLVQWDYGQILKIEGLELPDVFEVHFSNEKVEGDAKTQIASNNEVTIPDEYLLEGTKIYAWIFLHEGENDGATKYFITIPIDKRSKVTDETPTPVEQSAIDKAIAALNGKTVVNRVAPLNNTQFAVGAVIEAVGTPIYIDDVTDYAAYGITEAGWYVFSRIATKEGTVVTAGTTVTGAAGYIATIGEDHIDVAVKFDVAAVSQPVTITWAAGNTETFVFKATDLAIRNLDYRVTFYVYDIDEFATWEYALTTDETFADGKYYYTKDENDAYTLAEVTVGEAIPADTYYNHSKVTFEGMTRNITYVCNTPIDCPVVFNLPEIEDETHGCWFEIRFRHTGTYSSTLIVPEGVKVATEHTQSETAGMNMVDLHYTVVDDTKIWRFMNTHSTIPA